MPRKGSFPDGSACRRRAAPNFAVHVGLGDATGGPVETYAAESPFGTVQSSRPSDPSATYTWLDAPDLPSPERVPMRVYSEAWTHGGTNGVEWYFPARLMLDIVAVLGNAVPEDGYQAAAGLRVFDGPRDDAPFLVIAASFPASAYTPVRDRIAPAVGPGRPHAGADRSSELGFQVVTTQMAHTEAIMASDGPDNPIPAAIEAFVAAHAEPGKVAIPGL